MLLGLEPWVRIPPLPPLLVFHGEIGVERPAMQIYEARLRDKRGVNLISDALPFGDLWTSNSLMRSNASFLRSPVRRESLRPPPDGCRFA
jgi:hypothetical protein